MASLHSHSVYSIIDGRGTIEDYIRLAESDGQQSFALTDHGTLGGVIDLYTTAKKHATVKPIIGCELYVDVVELRERNFPGHLTVLAKNEAGYRALIAANNLSHRQFYYRPRITLQQLIDNEFCKDWIILSGCMSSPIFHQPMAYAENIVKQLKAHSGGFFLEAMWHWSADEEFNVKQNNYLQRVAELHKSTGIPIVITNDCHYADKHNEDFHIELLQQSRIPSELEFDGEGFHFKTLKQMQSICDGLGIPDALDNTVAVANMCSLVIPEADSLSWHVPDITGGHPYETLDAIARQELYLMRQHGYGEEYEKRYEYELAVLATSPAILNSYLVTYDVVQWCRQRDIPVAARGSMAGSLVSHLLGITAEDPVKYKLSFSRAVNPARPTIPDFDLDVSSTHRSEILKYLEERYEGNIPIAAYTHYGPKGAMRKIFRMEAKRDQQSINEICKELPDDWTTGGDFTYSPTQHKYVGKTPWVEKAPEQYINYLATYQGLYSSVSVHPSGVLISGPERPLEHEVPFQWIASSKTLSAALDMYALKKIGLFKLDVLGLRTLDALAYMEKVSEDRVPNDDYDEPAVLAAFGADLLSEIFQMDGYACRAVIRNIRGIETFEDIIAANTLARPGCAQFAPFYRTGYENLIREYAPIAGVLGPTNGLILYQEQVMEIARILADFDDSEQDDVKEAIKYFRHEVWVRDIEPKFRERCDAKGFDATNILAAISKMASYTYNRAHAMTYAAIAYKMMWYKVHYPAVFYAGVFDMSGDKPKLVLESHFFGIKWHPADINNSESETVVRNGEILLGLNAVKGVGPAAYEAIATARPFTSLADVENRINRRKCNVRVITSLKEAYALASLGEEGTPLAFQAAFGFNHRFLDASNSTKLLDWQKESPTSRAAGYLVGLRPTIITKNGQNKGKEMGRVNIVNISGSKNAVIWPDLWKKAKNFLYEGAAVKLLGEYTTAGDFIVHEGVEVS